MKFALAEDIVADTAAVSSRSTRPTATAVVDATNAVAAPRPSKRPNTVSPTTPSEHSPSYGSLSPQLSLPAMAEATPSTTPLAFPALPSELRAPILAKAQELHGLLSQWLDSVPYSNAAPVTSLLAHTQEIQHAVESTVPQQRATHFSSPPPPSQDAPTTTVAPPHTSHRASRRGAPQHDVPPSRVSLLVEFKRGRVKKYDALTPISPGQYAIVDGDRGTDCGLVILCCLRDESGQVVDTQSIDNCQIDLQRFRTESGTVKRVATQSERDLLHNDIATAERHALVTCRDLVAKMGITMQVMDCEYQFDRKKISFYFESEESVDFRELNVELYRIFGARIWLENLNNRVRNVVPDGALSHADKVMFQQSGLRPPRRR